MNTTMVPAPPTRAELESLTLADRVVLEIAFGEAADLIRSLNDAEIARLVDAGASLRAIAAAMGVHHSTASKRLGRLGLQTLNQQVSPPRQAVPQNGDGSFEDAEIVDAEIVPPRQKGGPPGQHLPDLYDDHATENPRVQVVHWFDQGRHVLALLQAGHLLEAKSPDDVQALKRDADLMIDLARQIRRSVK